MWKMQRERVVCNVWVCVHTSITICTYICIYTHYIKLTTSGSCPVSVGQGTGEPGRPQLFALTQQQPQRQQQHQLPVYKSTNTHTDRGRRNWILATPQRTALPPNNNNFICNANAARESEVRAVEAQVEAEAAGESGSAVRSLSCVIN